tara:strand:+ start:1277 stop:1855 length:579 start_codon:yes stop_codon:yes gene_type:complete
MNKPIIFIFVLSLIVAYGCTSSENITFKEGIERINEIDEKYGAAIKTPPNSTEKIDGLLTQITGFAALHQNMPLSLKYFVGFRIASLEAEKLHIQGWQWGKGSTTDFGFGCKKGSAKVLNSSKIRKESAQKGFEALDSLQLLVDNYPIEAKSINLTQKDILFLNAAYYQIKNKAEKDARIINSLCAKYIGKG